MTSRKPPREHRSFRDKKWMERVQKDTEEVVSWAELPFILVSNTSQFENDRSLGAESPITLTDSGGNSALTIGLDTIDISEHTNLAAASPITLSGDEVGFDETWQPSIARLFLHMGG